MADSESRSNVLVLGAGIIGLTTALKLQETGRYDVTILAETFPTDPRTIRYTSHWAGAHHVSHAEDNEQWQKIDRETFDIMWAHSAPDHPASHCFHRHQQTIYEATNRTHVKWLEHMPEFRYLSSDELLPSDTLGYTFRTVTITPSLYLSYLFSCFFANNGTAVRASLQHIDQVLEKGITPFLHAPVGANHNTGIKPRGIDALFVCTGLGSRSLGGVEDKRVYALRGQTVLLRAPWVRVGKSFNGRDGTYTYVMPRKNGDVGPPIVVGGMAH
ncbi:nucleotide-binding domain-containing protein [Imleria badia]|nr:nucleotide-binding domain-containing protein [Imleria badia]